jgi:hypothetical protein
MYRRHKLGIGHEGVLAVLFEGAIFHNPAFSSNFGNAIMILRLIYSNIFRILSSINSLTIFVDNKGFFIDRTIYWLILLKRACI